MQSQFQQFMRQLKQEYWGDEQQQEQLNELKPQTIEQKGQLKEMLEKFILIDNKKKPQNPVIKTLSNLLTKSKEINKDSFNQIAEELKKIEIKQQQKYVLGKFLHQHFTYFCWYHILCGKLQQMVSQHAKLNELIQGLNYINELIRNENVNKQQPKTKNYKESLEKIARIVKQNKSKQKQIDDVKHGQLQQIERLKKQIKLIVDQKVNQNQSKLNNHSQKQFKFEQQLQDINTKLQKLKVQIDNAKLFKPHNEAKKQDKKFSVSSSVCIKVQPTIEPQIKDESRNKISKAYIRVKQDNKFSVSSSVCIKVQPTIEPQIKDESRNKISKACDRVSSIVKKAKKQKEELVMKIKEYQQVLQTYMKSVKNKLQLMETKLKTHENLNNKKQDLQKSPDFFMWNLLAGYQIRAWQKSFDPHLKQGQYLVKIIQEYTKKKIVRTKLIYEYDQIVPLNFHTYVDGIQDYVVIAKLQNQRLIGAYSHQALTKGTPNKGPGLISSLTNQFTVYIEPKLPEYRTTAYNEFYIVFGNGEIRIQQSTRQVSSCFGKQYMFYRPKSNPEIFLGEKQQPVKFKQLQVHKVIFADNEQANNKTDAHKPPNA